MFIRYKYILNAFLLLGLVGPVFSFQPSGGVLSLDGEDDYAILRFPEHGYIFPRNTNAFTAEVWFYPKSEAEDPEKANIILSQQVRFGLKAGNCRGPLGGKDQVCAFGAAYLEGGDAHGVKGLDVSIKKDQWNYMAIIFTDSTFYVACNDQIFRGERWFMNFVQGDLRLPEGFKNFCVGGYAEDLLIPKDYFHGEIDAIRFSNIARYDLPKDPGTSPFDPPHRFVKDAHTLALWDFNDKEGTDRFKDTSGNGKTLTGMNGATVIGGKGLDIRPRNAVTTTWGQLKSDL